MPLFGALIEIFFGAMIRICFEACDKRCADQDEGYIEKLDSATTEVTGAINLDMYGIVN